MEQQSSITLDMDKARALLKVLEESQRAIMASVASLEDQLGPNWSPVMVEPQRKLISTLSSLIRDLQSSTSVPRREAGGEKGEGKECLSMERLYPPKPSYLGEHTLAPQVCHCGKHYVRENQGLYCPWCREFKKEAQDDCTNTESMD